MQPMTNREVMLAADQGRMFRKVLEAAMSVGAISMGFMFILTNVDDSDFLYRPMSIIAPYRVWGIFMLIAGVVSSLVLIVNGYWHHSYTVRKWLCVVRLFTVWLPVMSSFWWSFVITWVVKPQFYPGIIFASLVSACELLCFFAIASFVYVRKGLVDG